MQTSMHMHTNSTNRSGQTTVAAESTSFALYNMAAGARGTQVVDDQMESHSSDVHACFAAQLSASTNENQQLHAEISLLKLELAEKRKLIEEAQARQASAQLQIDDAEAEKEFLNQSIDAGPA